MSDRAVLKEALLDIGLNAEEALAKLEDQEARKEVRDKEAYWQNIGVRSVPTIVFDRKSAVTGAQPIDVFKKVLTEMLATA